MIKNSDKDGETVGLDEVITYTITVTNKGNVPYTNVKVVDAMTGDEWTIPELPVGKTETFTATYTVTSDDILKGIVLNSVTAAGDPIPDPDPDVPPHTPKDDDDEDDPTDPINTTLTVTKTSDKEGQKVALGETITYTITVKNDGNVPFTNVVVTDELTGDEWTIAELAVGAVETFTATYTVTSDDILAGKVINSVTGKGDPIPDPDPENPPHIPEDDDEIEDDPDPIDTTLTVTKTSDKDGQKVALGETITYTITVKNDGNVPFTNVVVTDELTGDEWTIAELAVGAVETFTATYTVTSDDILAGKVINSVTGKGDPIPDPDPENPPHIPEDDDEIEDDPDPIDGTLTVTKTSDVNVTAKVGDLVTYTITVKNDGNVPFNNVKVDDELTGMHETIETLAVGETVTFTTTLTVTKEDAKVGTVLNVAVTKADPIPNPDDPDNPVIPEDEDDEEVTVDPYPYKVIVHYWYDTVGGESAAPSYFAERLPGYAYSVESPVIAGYDVDVEIVKGVMGYDDVIYHVIYTAKTYDLTINYVYKNGDTAAESYTDTLKAGDKYSVDSPVIDGYVPSIKVVEGTMPTRDVVITVIYVKKGNGLTIIDEYDVPLGLGQVAINAGDCFE